MLVVPDFSQASSDANMSSLKSRCDASRTLGLARVDVNVNMVVYDGKSKIHCFRVIFYNDLLLNTGFYHAQNSLASSIVMEDLSAIRVFSAGKPK